MPAFVDITGQRFGLLTAQSYEGASLWLCQCDCGVQRRVKTGQLRSGQTKNCGYCVRISRPIEEPDDGLTTCRRCRCRKEPQQFFDDTSRQSGKHPYCKECHSAKTKAYYEKNKEKVLATCKRYYEENKDNVLETCKRWAQNNRDRVNEINRAWKKRNPDASNAYYMRCMERDPEAMRRKQKEKRNKRIEADREYQKNRQRNKRKELADDYVKQKLIVGTGLRASEIPATAVEMKRAQLRLRREVQKARSLIKGQK